MKMNKEEMLEKLILDLLPETGQLPFILWHQARSRLSTLSYEVTWRNMQVAFDHLYHEGKITEQQDFSRSIVKRAYPY